MLKMSFYICLALVVLFLWQKKKKKPTKLKLTAYRDPKAGLPGIKKVSAEVVDEEVYLHEGIFIFQGQKYLAYEVLSVPFGASAADLKRAFAQRSQLDPENKDLYFQAYQSLCK